MNSYDYSQEPSCKQYLFTLENLIKFVYILLVVSEYHICLFGIAASTLGIIRRKQMKTEFTMNILYLINISQFKCTNNLMYHLPIVVHFLIGVSDYLNLRKGSLYKRFKSFTITIQNTKEFFMDFRCKYELGLIPLSVIMIIVSESSWWLVILHCFYVITKIIASEQMQSIIQSIYKNYIQLKKL